MKKTLNIVYVILIFPSLYFSQEFTIPSFALTDIHFNLTIKEIPDTLKKINIIIKNSDYEEKLLLNVNNGFIDTSIVISESGYFNITSEEIKSIETEIRIIPGFLSIIPPLLAILLALIIRQVLVSLAAGIFIGAFFIYDFNPLIAFLRFADTLMMNALVDHDHMMIIVFTLLIGGAVGIISKNGGTAGLANKITKFAKTSRSGMLSSWLLGLAIFFDDYANSLIIGNMMRAITDKLRVSREKLAYIVDSTAAPVASIVIISTWIGYELGLISDGLKIIGSTENAYDVFLQTIPYRFYPIAALVFVFLTSYLRRDFGPMYKAEMRARQKGEVYEKNAKIKEYISEERLKYQGERPHWYNAAIPIGIILFGTIAGLFYTGLNALEAKGITEYSVQMIISNSDSYSSLLWSSFLACVVAIIMSTAQKQMKLNDSISAWDSGVKSMLFACTILVFAWAISSVTVELKTADYLISILSDSIDPRLLPVFVFLICALISFATGTSWGTMAIVMPIVIPLANHMTILSNFSPSESTLILHGVISSVLTGSVFGDHCSPIADTTILSSMASHCNHIDHVKTQLPYAILVGIFCMLIGDIPTAYGFNPLISLGIITICMVITLFVIGKKVPDAKMG
ncbi:MAG: Na+/H+ antiporter NhaC family protein [Ignavibacteriales bacterium]|nr:Na+/H+ antiporter NhaC family protein [Ignavibacteriales bacterium]